MIDPLTFGGTALAWLAPFFWIGSNVLVAYISIVLVVFVVAYPLLFDPSATTGGKLIFRFFISLFGVVGLVFVGVFVDPVMGRMWWQFPGDIVWWRPSVRFAIYAFVAYTITSLAVLLFVRKYLPHRVQTAPDQDIAVKIRNPKE